MHTRPRSSRLGLGSWPRLRLARVVPGVCKCRRDQPRAGRRRRGLFPMGKARSRMLRCDPRGCSSLPCLAPRGAEAGPFPGQLGAICDWHAYTSTADPGAGRSGPARRNIMSIEGLGCDNRQAPVTRKAPGKPPRKARLKAIWERVPKANTACAASRMRKSDKRGETRQHQHQQQGVPIAASENMDAALIVGGGLVGVTTHTACQPTDIGARELRHPARCQPGLDMASWLPCRLAGAWEKERIPETDHHLPRDPEGTYIGEVVGGQCSSGQAGGERRAAQPNMLATQSGLI